MQIQTVCCGLSNTHRTTDEQFPADPGLNSIYFMRQFHLITGRIEGCLFIWMVKMNFSVRAPSAPTFAGREHILQQVHMQEFWTCISRCPRFHQTCKGGERKERKGNWADTRDHISYSSVFSPSVSGRILRVWIINSLCIRFVRLVTFIKLYAGSLILLGTFF